MDDGSQFALLSPAQGLGEMGRWDAFRRVCCFGPGRRALQLARIGLGNGRELR